MENNLLKRWGHGAASLSVSSECVEVILFGRCNEVPVIADTVVLGFGMS